MSKEKEMNPSSQMVFDMAKIFLDIQTSSFASGMKHAKEDAERERKLQAFADKCERDLGEKLMAKVKKVRAEYIVELEWDLEELGIDSNDVAEYGDKWGELCVHWKDGGHKYFTPTTSTLDGDALKSSHYLRLFNEDDCAIEVLKDEIQGES